MCPMECVASRGAVGRDSAVWLERLATLRAVREALRCVAWRGAHAIIVEQERHTSCHCRSMPFGRRILTGLRRTERLHSKTGLLYTSEWGFAHPATSASKSSRGSSVSTRAASVPLRGASDRRRSRVLKAFVPHDTQKYSALVPNCCSLVSSVSLSSLRLSALPTSLS